MMMMMRWTGTRGAAGTIMRVQEEEEEDVKYMKRNMTTWCAKTHAWNTQEKMKTMLRIEDWEKKMYSSSSSSSTAAADAMEEQHKEEEEYYKVSCRVRRGGPLEDEAFGSSGSLRMRRAGLTPGIVQRAPAAALEASGDGAKSGKDALGIAMRSRDVEKLIKHFGGRRGLRAAVLELHVESPAAFAERTSTPSPETDGTTTTTTTTTTTQVMRVLPRVVHIGALSQQVENITMLACGEGINVSVDVPVRVLGNETSPGIKKGGYLNLVQKTLKMRCPSLHVPGGIEVDISQLDLNQTIKYTDIKVPEGCSLLVKDASLAVLKIGGKMRRM